MRGKVLILSVPAVPFGITPAYAGKRQGLYFKVAVIEDHPRLCGEKFRLALGDNDFTGSPPPMRGKGFVIFRNIYRNRITPAYAGKSKREPYSFRFSWDHPRLCGEK